MRPSAMKIALCLGIWVALMPQAEAKLTREQLEKAAQAAGVLPENSSITCQYGENNEVSMATYAGIKADDKDLKIDAVMLAKSLTDADSDISKVRVSFYNTQRTSFRSITVRNSDIKAFGTGLVDKDSLLRGLDVVVGSNIPDRSSRSTKRPAAEGWTKCTVDGITFLYPSTWSPREFDNSGGTRRRRTQDSETLMKIRPDSPGAYVELKWYPGAATLEKLFGAKLGSHSHEPGYATVSVPHKIRIGAQKSLVAYQDSYYYFESDRGRNERLFERQVYFAHGGRVCKFKLSCPVANAGSLNAAFTSLLDTVR